MPAEHEPASISEYIIDQLQAVDAAYGLGLMSTDSRRDRLRNDILQTIAHHDLKGVVLLVLHGGRQWLEYRIDGMAKPAGPVAAAFARSGALPPPPANSIALRGRLILWRKSSAASPPYEDRLQLQWRRTDLGGRKSDRRTLRIVRAGAQDYAFAETCDSGTPLSQVYCNLNQAPQGHRFSAGQLFEASLTETSKGWQAHQILPVG